MSGGKKAEPDPFFIAAKQWLEEKLNDSSISHLGHRVCGKLFFGANYEAFHDGYDIQGRREGPGQLLSWPGQKRMARELGATKNGVCAALKQLKKARHFEIMDSGCGCSYSTRYRLLFKDAERANSIVAPLANSDGTERAKKRTPKGPKNPDPKGQQLSCTDSLSHSLSDSLNCSLRENQEQPSPSRANGDDTVPAPTTLPGRKEATTMTTNTDAKIIQLDAAKLIDAQLAEAKEAKPVDPRDVQLAEIERRADVWPRPMRPEVNELERQLRALAIKPGDPLAERARLLQIALTDLWVQNYRR